mmetsp:Transcript_71986/g.158964  ORF Transcript_71986/g.158964 Transcript_71986/m.158964 type:complete len:98 (-) Transcript_71986:445-738(-)
MEILEMTQLDGLWDSRLRLRISLVIACVSHASSSSAVDAPGNKHVHTATCTIQNDFIAHARPKGRELGRGWLRVWYSLVCFSQTLHFDMGSSVIIAL